MAIDGGGTLNRELRGTGREATKWWPPKLDRESYGSVCGLSVHKPQETIPSSDLDYIKWSESVSFVHSL